MGSIYMYKYDYEGYDKHGNWTEQKKATRIGSDLDTIVHRRTLAYF
jgi:hypothetical protein